MLADLRESSSKEYFEFLLLVQKDYVWSNVLPEAHFTLRV